MNQSQIIEDIALILVLAKLQEFSSMRFSHVDFSMESVLKKEAKNRGVEYQRYLPKILAEKVHAAIKDALGEEFEIICERFSEAILWEANFLVYGGDLGLLQHPGAADYLASKNVEYKSPVIKFEAPKDEVAAIKKALFDH